MTREVPAAWLVGDHDWAPTGTFDTKRQLWVTDPEVLNRFPDSGVELFHAVDDESFWFAHRNTVIATLLDRFGNGTVMLEVGSGSGVVAAELTERGYDVAAVEPIATGAQMAAERGVRLSVCGDLQSLHLPDGSIPNVGLFDVIEHLDEPERLLGECRRILEPDGKIFITVPAHQWLWSYFDEWNGHRYRYSRSSLIEQLGRAGFETLWCSYFFLPLILPALLRRLRSAIGSAPADQVEDRLVYELAPPALLDRTLRLVLAPERVAIGRARIPTGTSVVFVGRPGEGA